MPESNTQARATAAFARLFGKPIDLWVFLDGQWWHAVDPCPHELEPGVLEAGVILPEDLPPSPATAFEPVVVEVASGMYLILAALALPSAADTAASGTIVAFGTIQTTVSTLAATLLRLSNEQVLLRREVDEAQVGLTPHLEQISYDFEELTWLRRLNERFDYCDVGRSLADLAHQILPDLCTLVKAEGMVFVSARQDHPSTDLAAVQVGPRLAHSGICPLDDAGCTSLIESLRRDERQGEPLVLNGARFRDKYPQFPEIDSCIYVSVIHHGKCFGWLLALNRIPWARRAGTARDQVPLAFCDDDFGTCEASLIQAAGGPLAVHAHNAALFREKELLLIGVVRTIINALDAKDTYTCGHSDRVAMMAKSIGERMGLNSRECERLYMAGLLHDIGKIGVPDDILKKPGKLTEEEFAIVRKHPGIGHAILSHLPQLSYVLPGVLHHHESVDGRGYPDRLRGDEIPLSGRILAVADAYDAMTSCRPYRTAMSSEKAEAILAGGAGTQWDARVIQAFGDCATTIKKLCADAGKKLPDLLPLGSTDQPVPSDSRPDAIAQAISLISN